MSSQTIEQAKAILDGSTFATGSKTAEAIETLSSHCATLEAELKAEKLRADKAECAAYQELATHCRSLEAENAELQKQLDQMRGLDPEEHELFQSSGAALWMGYCDLKADLTEALELLIVARPSLGALDQPHLESWQQRRDALLKRRGEG